MNEDKEPLTEQETAAVVAAAMAAAAAEAADPVNQLEWIKQSNMIYGGLMAVGLVMVQPFLTAPLDVSAYVCVIAFAVSTPLLAALLLVNRQEEFRRRATQSRIVQFTKAIAQGSAFVGVAAAFWHISWIAAVVLIVSAVLGLGAQSAGYFKLDYDSNFRRRKDTVT